VTADGSPPLHWVILKVVQRCNLDCSYCYVYNRGDESWKERPPFISESVTAALGRRIAEQCAKYSLTSFTVELHGGEPLLLGKRRLQRVLDLLRALCPGITLRFVLQTNGLLLDEEWLVLFDRNGIRFSISVDGPPEYADLYRVKRNGEGSTTELLKLITALRASSPLFDKTNSGALCVVNPNIDGAEMVRWFADQGFRGFDFILPNGNYVNPPAGWIGPEPYLQFLVSAFNEWYRLGEGGPRIRTFELMIRALMGATPVLDALGGDLQPMCVVETGGSIALSDFIRICGGKYSRDVLNVFENALDEHARYYELDLLQRPADKCLSCPYFDCCGGGYLPNRFDGESFNNPSIYCDALCGLADVIAQRLRVDVPESLWRRKEVDSPFHAS